MVDKILLDTNILLDYLLMREPFYDNASEIVRRCVDGIYIGCVAAHSISNMFFILRKTTNSCVYINPIRLVLMVII